MITDEMIAEAAAKYNDALVQYWQNVEMEEHEFSWKFQQKMQRLICKVKYPYLHKVLKSAACILIAFLISFASVMTFDVEARAAFTRWIRKVYEDSIVYEFFGEKSETASLDYRVTWVPEGYELVEEFVLDTSYDALYQKGEDYGDAFTVHMYIMKEDNVLKLLANDDEYECLDITVKGCKGYFYKSTVETESHTLLWFDEKNDIYFFINSYLDFETINKIAENIY